MRLCLAHPLIKLNRREYYERTNDLIQQYLYIDALLDSAIPHDLLNEYQAELDSSAFRSVDVPDTIAEETTTTTTTTTETSPLNGSTPASFTPGSYGAVSVKPNNSSTKLPATRTPQDIFRSSENLPLLQRPDHSEGEDEEPPSVPASQGDDNGPKPLLPWLEDAEIDSDDPIVTLAIWVNFIANGILLAGKLAVIVSVPSMSVLASLVDAVLDFLSTIIVWITTRLISSSHHDQYSYPVGRRK